MYVSYKLDKFINQVILMIVDLFTIDLELQENHVWHVGFKKFKQIQNIV